MRLLLRLAADTQAQSWQDRYDRELKGQQRIIYERFHQSRNRCSCVGTQGWGNLIELISPKIWLFQAENKCFEHQVKLHKYLEGRPIFGTSKGRKPLIYGLLPFVTFAYTHIQLVEARGIEPLSENSSIQLSTSVFYLLKFPWQTAGKRAGCQSSPYTTQGHGHSPASFTTNRCPSGSRGTHPVDRSWLKQLPVRYF